MFSSLARTYKFISQHPLGSQHKLAALSRWLRWQLGSRLLRQPVVMPFIEDAVLVASTGMEGATGNIYCGLHEFTDMAFLLHLLRPEDQFADIGANIGSYTILAGKVIGSRTHAFEPVPSTFQLLNRNIRANNIEGHVQAHQSAVGSRQGEILFSIDQDSTNQVVSADYHGKSMKVPVIPLNDALANIRCVLWKIDVEGFEEEVIAGASQVLLDLGLKAVLLESDSAKIAQTMTDAGFARATYNPFTRTVGPAAELEANCNNLWIRDLSFVQERCKSARTFEAAGVKF